MARTHAPGKVTEIRMEPVTGEKGGEPGIMSHTTTAFKRGGTGGGPSFDHETEPAMHTSLASAHAHITKHFSHVFGHEPKEGHEDKQEEETEE